MTFSGFSTTKPGNVTNYSNPTVSGFEYALLPSANSGNETENIYHAWTNFSYYGTFLQYGHNCSGNRLTQSPFTINFAWGGGDDYMKAVYLGCRLMKLPNNK
jgi:hypothetical protein